ncbi:hypothetical protein [Aestuariivirga litoralis]|uniref:hypothetical protein n=1 Tax=Aestuariivirga litoralis TaxID=2650924 RepID=UPI0018C6BFA3|nr:hypothetical protein [Aestuariivirga litoralis]MBG1233490.1 hypothetical protein [Aestuariivirga litoralis]
MLRSILMLIALLCLNGCAHHPVDCAMCGSLGALHDDCLPGTAGYQERDNRERPINDLIALEAASVQERVQSGQISKAQGELEIAEYKHQLSEEWAQREASNRASAAAALMAINNAQRRPPPPATYQIPAPAKPLTTDCQHYLNQNHCTSY